MRVFCCSYQEYALEAVRHLAKSHGWRPVYFQTTRAIEGRVKRLFPEAVRHRYLDAVKGRAASRYSRRRIAVNRDVVSLMKANGELATAIKMFDRNQSVEVPMSEPERIELIEWFTGYWTEVLSDLKVDIVLFEEVPHQVSDYILYVCARHLMVERIVPIRTLPRSGFLISDAYDRFDLLPRSADLHVSAKYQSLVQYAALMNGTYAKYAQTMFFDASDTMKLFADSVGPAPRRSYISAAKQLVSKAARAAALSLRFANDRKEAGRSLPASNQSYFAHRRGMKATIATKLKLKRLYEHRAADRPSSDTPYIFCALQYQPEASTSPKGGAFVDQLLMVRLLLDIMPSGWRLVVKEHPNQFSSKYARFAETARSAVFYDELTADPRVHLVPLATPSFELVDGARAVASVGGTICLESVVRGTPSLNFGTGFFDRVEGIFKVSDQASGQAAMAAILEGFEPIPERVLTDLQEIDSACYPGAIGGAGTLVEMGLTQEQNARIHAASWLDGLARRQATAAERS